jgi:undecaprenyl diphosphate synthase
LFSDFRFFINVYSLNLCISSLISCIRTSGEQRLSNYLLWQLAYAEFYFTDVPWPAFDKNELKKAIDAYNKRDRRFGGLKETNDTEDK